MAKKKTVEGQQDLIDVTPKNIKEIMAAAKLYKKHQAARLTAGKAEEREKERVKTLVKEANLQPIEGGIIKFNYDGFTISLTPRDILVQIVEEVIKPPKDK
jgi:hypothetical protein